VSDREQIAHAIEIMKAVSRDVCDGFEIGVGIDQQLEGGARYADKRPVAKKMWATVIDALERVRAVPANEEVSERDRIHHRQAR
jgi:hypothetical protein